MTGSEQALEGTKLWPGGMRADELEYYSDGAWYDSEYVHMGGDIPFYSTIARNSPGPILELACGTGRLTFPMAHTGADVVGVDVAPGMIAEAELKRARLSKEEQSRLQFVVDDMRSIRFARRFPTVVLAFNTLMHMTRDEDLAATLETVATHLTDDGTFHLDVHTPHPSVVPRADPDGRYDAQEMVDARSKKRYIVTENNHYDPRTQINEMRFFYQEVDRSGRKIGGEQKRVLRLRVIFPRELDKWLRDYGFETVVDLDDFEKTRPFSGEGGRRVMSLKKRPSGGRKKASP